MQVNESEAKSFITLGSKEEHERLSEVARVVKMQKRRRMNGIERTTSTATSMMNGKDYTDHEESFIEPSVSIEEPSPAPVAVAQPNSNGDAASPPGNKKGKGIKLFDKLKRGGKDADSDLSKDDSVTNAGTNPAATKADIAELTKLLRCLKSLDGVFGVLCTFFCVYGICIPMFVCVVSKRVCLCSTVRSGFTLE